ncbi:hypothetical protein BHE74_00046989, partial [Ensete ventricosum]
PTQPCTSSLSWRRTGSIRSPVAEYSEPRYMLLIQEACHPRLTAAGHAAPYCDMRHHEVERQPIDAMHGEGWPRRLRCVQTPTVPFCPIKTVPPLYPSRPTR